MISKLPLKVLFPILIPYTEISRDGKIGGPFDAVLERIILYPLRKFNVTYVPFSLAHSLGCSISDCPIILQSLRNGSVDYYPWNSILPQIYSNLSLGSIKTATSCRIWTRSYKKYTINHNYFENSYKDIDQLTLVLLTVMTFLPICLIAHLKGTSFLKAFYYTLGILFHKSSFMYTQLTKLTKSRIAVVGTVFYIFFCQTIILSNLQTGLVAEGDYGKLLTIADFDNYQINPFHSSFGHCLPLLSSRIERNENEDLKLNGMGKIVVNRDPINVAIINDDEASMVSEYLCSSDEYMNRIDQNFYLSPVIMDGIVNLIKSVFTPEQVFKPLNKAIGSIFETGAEKMANQLLGNFVRVWFNNMAEQSCLGTLYHPNSDTSSSLSIHFFRIDFLAYSIVVFIAIIAFLAEMIIG